MFRQACLQMACGVSAHSSMSTQETAPGCSLKPAAQKHLCRKVWNKTGMVDEIRKRMEFQLVSPRTQSVLTGPFGVLTQRDSQRGADRLEQLRRAHPAPSSELSAQLVKPLHTRPGSTHSPLPHSYRWDGQLLWPPAGAQELGCVKKTFYCTGKCFQYSNRPSPCVAMTTQLVLLKDSSVLLIGFLSSASVQKS